MKAVLEFDLDDPNDRNQHRQSLDGIKAHIVLWDLDQWLCKKINAEDTSKAQALAYQETMRHFIFLLDKYRIDLE